MNIEEQIEQELKLHDDAVDRRNMSVANTHLRTVIHLLMQMIDEKTTSINDFNEIMLTNIEKEDPVSVTVHTIINNDENIIKNIQKAPEREVFYIDVGNLPPVEAANVIEKFKNELTTAEILEQHGDNIIGDVPEEVKKEIVKEVIQDMTKKVRKSKNENKS